MSFLFILMALAILLGIASCVFWIWALVDCARSSALNGNERLVWILVILFLHVLGALIYVLAAPRAGRS